MTFIHSILRQSRSYSNRYRLFPVVNVDKIIQSIEQLLPHASTVNDANEIKSLVRKLPKYPRLADRMPWCDLRADIASTDATKSILYFMRDHFGLGLSIPGYKNINGLNIFHKAIQEGNEELAIELIANRQRGMSYGTMLPINAKNREGQTGLQMELAKPSPSASLVKTLLRFGAVCETNDARHRINEILQNSFSQCP